jgi:N-acetylornithine carbamoyltransferase
MKHFLTTQDYSRAELEALLQSARRFRREPHSRCLANMAIALVFFNNSLRTRASFQIGAFQLGARPVVLEPGTSSWPMEMRDGVVMDEVAEEHAAEAIPVLSRYFDLLAVRSFPKFQDWETDLSDPVLSAFARYSGKPVINMETIVHPCQELALMMALQDRFENGTQNKKFVLTWVPHPKPLNTAVANSALLIASKFGFDVTLVAPHEDYRLGDHFMQAARADAQAQGGSVTFTTDLKAAYDGADVVYAKSWGAIPYFRRWDEEAELRKALNVSRFTVDMDKVRTTNNARVSHCLPMRRNVKITDEVCDSDHFIAIDEAENRLHVQKAIMAHLASEYDGR